MNSLRETLLCQYRYDGLDRLIGNEFPDRPTLRRFYCKSRLATEIQGVMQHSIIQHGDLLLAQKQRQGDGVDTTLLATDLQRSVLQTIKANNGRRPIAYSPYGHRPAESGLSSLLGFNGERPDPVAGYYLLGNGYRAFNPVLMRFNSPDNLSPFGKGGLYSYAYCSGDPTNSNDQSGRIATKIIAGMISHWRERTKATLALTNHTPLPRARISRARLHAREPASTQMINAQSSQPTIAVQPATPPAYAPWDLLGSVESINEYGIPASLNPPRYFKFAPPVSFNKFPSRRPADESSQPIHQLPRSHDDTPHETLTTHLRTTDEINTRYTEMQRVIAQRRIRNGSNSDLTRHKKK